MPITSRSEYGMRAMILLAEQAPDDLVSASEVSRREHIPLKYLEQLLSELKKAGLVASHPGARGGYRLARPASDVPVAEIVRALDGPFAPMSCVADGERPPCAFEANCKLRPLWSRLHLAVHEVLDQTTLAELAAGMRLEARGAAHEVDAPMPELEEAADGGALPDPAGQPHCAILNILHPTA